MGVSLAQTTPPLDSQPTLTATEDGISVEWRTPDVAFTRETDGTFSPTLPGYTQLNQPGLPRLPMTAVLVALPPAAESSSLEVLSLEETELPLPGPLALAPRPAGVERNAVGEVIGGAFEPVLEMAPFTFNVVELQPVGNVRGVRLARLVFYPIRPEGEKLRLTTHVRVFLHYNAPAQKSHASSNSDAFLSTLNAAVVNPEAIQSASTTPTAQTSSPGLASVTPRVAIEVSQAGVTAITYAALNAIGFSVTNTNNVHLTRAGQEIVLEWDGDADMIFEAGERFLFYADPRFSRWTTTDVYFLTVDTTLGLRMSSRSASPTGLTAGNVWMDQTAEMNALYTPDCYCAPIPPGRDGDRWTWDVLRRPDRASITYTINLPTVSVTQPATLTTWFIGYTDVGAAPDHRVNEKLNGITVGQVEWDGKQAITATLPISSNVLVNGNNSLNLALPGLTGVSVEGMWLDAFSIRYARGSATSGNSALFTGDTTQRAYTLSLNSTTGLRAYDVTDSIHPQRLISVTVSSNSVTLGDPASGWPRRYALAAESGILAPAKLRLASSLTGAPAADYIAIAPSAFIPALANLVSLRESQSLSVVVEDVQAIYDAYDGRPTPDAIRAYLDSWNPRPEYVLLVGDGTYDPKHYRNDSAPTFIPPYLADVDPWIGETAADNRYVTLDGNDVLPDILLGRLPVNTITETQTVVNKIVQYETNPFPGGWNANAAFVADNADSGGDFPAESEVLATNYIDPPFVAQRIYYYGPPTSTVTSTHAAILSRWNAGAGLMLFTGHSSTHQWAEERLFHSDDIAALTNGRQLPVLLEMTCFTGSFQVPNSVTMDEALARHPNGGAVAVWGATGLGISTGHQFLAAGFLNSLYTPGETLGEAALAGKISLVNNDPADIDLVDTYTLLGDPALKLDLTIVPWSASLYLPVIRR